MTDLRSYPCLRTVYEPLDDRAREKYLDPVSVLDHGIARAMAAGFTAEDCDREVQALLALGPSAQLWEHVDRLGLHEVWGMGPLESTTICRITGERFRLRAEAGAQYDPAGDVDTAQLRVSTFADEATAQRAISEGLRARRSFVEQWAAQPEGLDRIWVSTDLGRELGTVMVAEPGGGTRAIRSGVTQVVVVMARREGRVLVENGYPDLPLAHQWQQHFPLLGNVFGVFLGQDHRDEHGGPWEAFERLALTLHEPARSRVATQLGQLLTLPEAEVRAAVHALGSYLVPADSRAWVERIRWALTAWEAGVPDSLRLDLPPQEGETALTVGGRRWRIPRLR
ncbi:MAG: RNase A-like domain-containing protein [Motilibacteraceae bacterium]